jgi:hypothetical protein
MNRDGPDWRSGSHDVADGSRQQVATPAAHLRAVLGQMDAGHLDAAPTMRARAQGPRRSWPSPAANVHQEGRRPPMILTSCSRSAEPNASRTNVAPPAPSQLWWRRPAKLVTTDPKVSSGTTPSGCVRRRASACGSAKRPRPPSQATSRRWSWTSRRSPAPGVVGSAMVISGFCSDGGRWRYATPDPASQADGPPAHRGSGAGAGVNRPGSCGGS